MTGSSVLGSTSTGAQTSKPLTDEEDSPLATATQKIVVQPGRVGKGGTGGAWCLQQMGGEG